MLSSMSWIAQVVGASKTCEQLSMALNTQRHAAWKGAPPSPLWTGVAAHTHTYTYTHTYYTHTHIHVA